MTDALTGLPNRRLLESHVTRFAADSARTGLPFTVVALDLDGLKKVNDELGHDAGDAVLRQFGQSIDRVIRGSDVGVRTGGDEFVLLLPRTSEVQAKAVVERLYVEADRLPPICVSLQLRDRLAPERRVRSGSARSRGTRR